MKIKLSDYELGWLVGILEGEGTFRYQNTENITLASTDEDVVISCAHLFSKITGNVFAIGVDGNGRTKDNPRKDIYRVSACGWNARTILKTIVPYMHVRRRARIWQVINKYKEPKKLRLSDSGLDIKSLMNRAKEIA